MGLPRLEATGCVACRGGLRRRTRHGLRKLPVWDQLGIPSASRRHTCSRPAEKPAGERALAKHLQPRHPSPFQAPDQDKRGHSKRAWDISPCGPRYDEPPGQSLAALPRRKVPPPTPREPKRSDQGLYQTCRRGDWNDRLPSGAQRQRAAETADSRRFRRPLPRRLPLDSTPCRGLPLAIR